jgi:hypothetical protein
VNARESNILNPNGINKNMTSMMFDHCRIAEALFKMDDVSLAEHIGLGTRLRQRSGSGTATWVLAKQSFRGSFEARNLGKLIDSDEYPLDQSAHYCRSEPGLLYTP